MRACIRSAMCCLFGAAVALAPHAANASGIFSWVGAFTGETNLPTDIITDNSNSVYICGAVGSSFSSQIDANPAAGTATLNGPAGYIVKLTNQRVFVWGVTIAMEMNGMAVTPAGNVVFVGSFTGTVDFNPGGGTANLTATDGEDGVVVELTTNGAFVQAFQLAGAAEQQIDQVAVDSSGNIHITGTYTDTTDFDPTGGTNNLAPTVAGRRDVFVAKYTSGGTLTWAAAFHGNDSDTFNQTVPRGIGIDPDGGVVTTGSFIRNLDWDPGAGVQNVSANSSNDTEPDAYFSKLDSNGNFVYVRRLGSGETDKAGGMAIDPETGDAVFSGDFDNVVDIDPGLGSNNQGLFGALSVYVVRLDAAGSTVWSKTYMPRNEGEGHTVAVDNEGAIHLTGTFNNVVDFDPGPDVFNLTETANGSEFPNNDLYVLKLDDDGDFVFAKGYGNSLPHAATALTTDTANASLYAGYFQNTLTFNPGNGVITSTQHMGTHTFNSYFLKLAGPIATVWVDFGSAASSQTGAESTPFKTLLGGVNAVAEDGTLNIKGNTGDSSSSETIVIDKAMTILAVNGAVTIGQQ